MTHDRAPMEHTDAELLDMLAKMDAASRLFYSLAVRAGCHGFIEFTGLMNEYINVCRQTLEAGQDFTLSNTHAEKPLVIQDYQISYFAEKFDCIFGPTLRAHPESRKILAKMLGLG